MWAWRVVLLKKKTILIFNSVVLFFPGRALQSSTFTKKHTLLLPTLISSLSCENPVPDCKASSWSSAIMSQLQFQSPGSPVPSSTPLQLVQPQPVFSIPSATGSLPSESASHPLRSSALPSASATPFCNPTGRWMFVRTLHILYCVSFHFSLIWLPYSLALEWIRLINFCSRCKNLMFAQVFKLQTSNLCSLKSSWISLTQLDFAVIFH